MMAPRYTAAELEEIRRVAAKGRQRLRSLERWSWLFPSDA